MRTLLAILPSLAAAVVGICVAGCEGGATPRALVQGKILFKGVALTTGVIVFAPDGNHGCHGPLACGLVQRDGSYHLQTDNQPGAPPGWYRVTVVAVEPANDRSPGQAVAIPRTLLPEKYRDPDLSGLVREIKGEQANQIDFNLD
jgi:hypothetical protein